MVNTTEITLDGSGVPMSDDVKNWKKDLTEQEKHLLTQILRFFTQADIEVNNCYMKHYSRVFKPIEIQMMLSAFFKYGNDSY